MEREPLPQNLRRLEEGMKSMRVGQSDLMDLRPARPGDTFVVDEDCIVYKKVSGTTTTSILYQRWFKGMTGGGGPGTRAGTDGPLMEWAA